MKLLVKTNIYYLLFSILAFAFGSLIFYVIISNVIYDEIDETLLDKKAKIVEQLSANDSLPDFNNAFDSHITIALSADSVSQQFIDTVFFNKEENEDVAYRSLIFSAKSNGKIYRFAVSKSLIESEDLIQGIIVSTLLVFLILLLMLISFNYFISKKIWRPFNKTLESLEKFDVTSNVDFSITENNITEFKKLNEAICRMTDKMKKDFSIQKEFTENASHEIQTPLSIIKSKLELLLQEEGLKENQVKFIRETYDAANRLSKLNQALLLITKIENQQFPKKESIDFGSIITKHLKNFEELIAEKNIELNVNYNSSKSVSINPLLADILISNLIGNAIKHNIPNGKINITYTDLGVMIENSGNALVSDPVDLFNRFRKDKQNSESLGLGLSIVKKIAETSGMQVEYSFTNGLHSVAIIF